MVATGQFPSVSANAFAQGQAQMATGPLTSVNGQAAVSTAGSLSSTLIDDRTLLRSWPFANDSAAHLAAQAARTPA
jgi:hypothetical protein